MQFEAIKNSSRLIITVDEDGLVSGCLSPTHECFNPIFFMGRPWTEVRKKLVYDGFMVHGGN